MDKIKILQDTQALSALIFKINQREPDAIAELNRLYRLVFGETVVAGCTNCHIKAYHRLTQLTLNDLIIMEQQNFKLKKNAMVQYPANSGQYYTSKSGITDKQAIELLINHPNLIDKFEVYPGSEDETPRLRLPKTEQVEKENIIVDTRTAEEIENENIQRQKDEEAAQAFTLRKTRLEELGYTVDEDNFVLKQENGNVLDTVPVKDIKDATDEGFEEGFAISTEKASHLNEVESNPADDFKEPIVEAKKVPAASAMSDVDKIEYKKKLTKMNLGALTAEYLKVIGTAPAEGTTRKVIIEALTA